MKLEEIEEQFKAYGVREDDGWDDLVPKLIAVAYAAKAFTEVDQLEPWDMEAENAFNAIEKALAALERT